jgi:hypothetical protein
MAGGAMTKIKACPRKVAAIPEEIMLKSNETGTPACDLN